MVAYWCHNLQPEWAPENCEPPIYCVPAEDGEFTGMDICYCANGVVFQCEET